MNYKKQFAIIFCLICPFLSSKEFVLFTEPKTGTHLLIPILASLTGKTIFWAKDFQNRTSFLIEEDLDLENPNHIYFSLDRTPWTKKTMDTVWKINKQQGSFLHLHAPYSPALENYLLKKNCINFFLKRDPRDQIVSLLNHYKHIHLNDDTLKSITSDEERLLIMIKKNSRKSTKNFMGWINSPACFVLDFSKLMGSYGGAATDLEAIDQMRKIATALEINISDENLETVYRGCFGKGWNFFRGKVGVWKEYFGELHKAAAKEEIGDLLIELGYEKDLNW